MKRNLHVALATLAAAAVITGCGGSGATTGGGFGPNPISTATPTLAPGATATPTLAPGATATPTLAPGATATPTLAPGTTATPTLAPGATATPTHAPGATATPTLAPGATPSPTPSPGTSAAIYHPGNNGDAFTMNGTLLVTYDRANQYPSPEPTSTTFVNVAQSVAVTNPASYAGMSGVDFKISETDSQTAPAPQTFGVTLDHYFKYSNTMATGNFLDLGYASVDDTGYKVTLTNGANDMLADILPEASGATWTNMAGRTVTTDDGNGVASSTTYNDDGSYTGTTTYQNYMPSPNPTGSQLTNTATLTSNPDGSANYNTPRLGTGRKYNYVYALSAPSAAGSGTITETTTIPPAAGSTAAPTTSTTAIPNWMPASVPGSLANETDIDNGPVALPAACPVPASLAGTPNQIVQTKMSVDPLNGELETMKTTTYDTANVGPVCVIIDDVQTDYYDYSGQNGVGYFSGTPQQTTTVNEVLYLSAETLKSVARHPEASARGAFARSVNVATAQARISVARIAARTRRLNAAARAPRYRSFRSFRGVL